MTIYSQSEVGDVLACWRDSGHRITGGDRLGPALLGRPSRGGVDHFDMMTALYDLLETEIAQRRESLKVTGPGVSARWDQRLAADRAANDQLLEALSMAWAYYIDRQETAAIVSVFGGNQRQVQRRIEAGRIELAERLRLREQQRVAAQAARPGSNGNTPPAARPSSTGGTADAGHSHAGTSGVPPSARAARRPRPLPPRRSAGRAAGQQVVGDRAQVVLGPVQGSVQQVQTQHVHQYAEAAPQTLPEDGATWLFRLGMAGLLVAGYWLISTAPWLGLGALVAVCGWRGLRHGWRALAGHAAGADLRAWRIGYALAWLGALGWSITLLRWQSQLAAAEAYALDRLMLAVVFVSLCGFVFWLGALDLLVWVAASGTGRWPWRLLERHASWLWRTRWLMLGLSWLMLAVFSIALLLFLAAR